MMTMTLRISTSHSCSTNTTRSTILVSMNKITEHKHTNGLRSHIFHSKNKGGKDMYRIVLLPYWWNLTGDSQRTILCTRSRPLTHHSTSMRSLQCGSRVFCLPHSQLYACVCPNGLCICERIPVFVRCCVRFRLTEPHTTA